jgi:hypothetical protein
VFLECAIESLQGNKFPGLETKGRARYGSNAEGKWIADPIQFRSIRIHSHLMKIQLRDSRSIAYNPRRAFMGAIAWRQHFQWPLLLRTDPGKWSEEVVFNYISLLASSAIKDI